MNFSTDVELIEMVFFPAKQVEDDGCELHKGHIVGDLEDAVPIFHRNLSRIVLE
jgi:hypothetical protein